MEVLLAEFQDLPASRMIDGLDANDMAGKQLVVLVEIPFEGRLGEPGTNDQHLGNVADQANDRLEEIDIIARVARP